MGGLAPRESDHESKSPRAKLKKEYRSASRITNRSRTGDPTSDPASKEDGQTTLTRACRDSPSRSVIDLCPKNRLAWTVSARIASSVSTGLEYLRGIFTGQNQDQVTQVGEIVFFQDSVETTNRNGITP